MTATPVILQPNTPTVLGTITPVNGFVSLTLDRTVSPNAVTAKPIDQVTATTVLFEFQASKDGGSTWSPLASFTLPAGSYKDNSGVEVVFGAAVSVTSDVNQARIMATLTGTKSALAVQFS